MIHGDTLTIDAFWTDKQSFPTEEAETTQIGHIFHDYYLGDASHLGWMDLVQLRTIIKQHNISHIILEKLDVLGQIATLTKELKICNGYLYNGQVICKLPKKVDFKRCHPIYDLTRFGGWYFTNNSYSIPHRAESYLRCLLVHTKVESVTCYTNKVKVTAYWDKNSHPDLKTEKI